MDLFKSGAAFCLRTVFCLLGFFGAFVYVQAECIAGVNCPDACPVNCQAGCTKSERCLGGCRPGWRGIRCDQRCSKFYYGPNCSKSCGHCRNDEQCDFATGQCQNGCIAGWRGAQCKEACQPFTYGYNCTGICGKCRLHKACNKMTGSCSGGCQAGTRGDRCDKECPEHTYGADCFMSCGHCRNGTACDKATGNCTSGCAHGWIGDKCDQRCPPGFYGESCGNTCGKCQNGVCDTVTGTCRTGCLAGWMGSTCYQKCVNGTYGPNCMSKCGHCDGTEHCDSVRGICASGCTNGWRGIMCQESCPKGFYGQACTYKCGNCADGMACEIRNGSCPNGCLPGYTGHNCIESSGELIAEPMMNEFVVSILVSCIVVLGLLFSTTVIYFMCVRPKHGRLFSRFYRLSTRSLQSPELHLYEQVVSGPWELNKYNLVLTNEKLGHGQFGMVKKGYVKQDRDHKIPVAVKSLKDTSCDRDKNDFMNELNILKKVGQHPNVVCLVGACHIQGTMYVAMEFCTNGDLRSYLRKMKRCKNNLYANTKTISPVQKSVQLKLSLDVASGLSHLADRQIIHRDVAARNVLLDEHLIAKVADFGLSKNDDTYVKTSNTRVPVKWLAPESLFNATYTTQSDVWSFGVLLWEISTLGGTPYHGIDTAQMCNLLKQGFRMRRPRNCEPALYAMMLQCWNEKPESRPYFSDIVLRLQRMLEDSQVYMNLDMPSNASEGNPYAEIK